MSKVIKNDDGVTVVEGTPSASIIKDVDKFFASKPPERMAGESISQPRKINKNNILSEKEYYQQFEDKEKEMGGRGRITPERYEDYLKKQQPGYQEEKAAAIQRERELIEQAGRVDRKPSERLGRPVGGNPNRNEAKDNAESRRKRFLNGEDQEKKLKEVKQSKKQHKVNL